MFDKYVGLNTKSNTRSRYIEKEIAFKNSYEDLHQDCQIMLSNSSQDGSLTSYREY